jgi:hypothetical protein
MGAVNMLVDIASYDQSMSKNLHKHLRNWQRMIAEQALAAFAIEDLRELVREMEFELARPAPRNLN